MQIMDRQGIQIFTQKNLTFILTDKRIVVRTRLQSFFLEERAPYWKRRVNLIRTMVVLNEIRDLNELAEWCGQGVKWTSTSRKYDLELKEQV